MPTPKKGILLVANPFLKDPNFLRTVVLICDYGDDGTYGLNLSREMTVKMKDILPEMTDSDFPVFMGGPVQPDSLHFIHQYPALITESVEVREGIYAGGSFESVIANLNNNNLQPDKIKFFVGYSGWAPLQLEMELKEDSWLTVSTTKKLTFITEAKDVWEESLREMGGEYTRLINYPLDPQLN